MSTQELRQTALTEEEPLDDDQEPERVATWLRRFTLISCALAAVAGGALAAELCRPAVVGRRRGKPWCSSDWPSWPRGVPKAAWLSGVVFGGFALLAAISIWQGDAPEWALGAITASLIGWDLHDFRRRLAAIERVAAPPRLIRGHLRRLFTHRPVRRRAESRRALRPDQLRGRGRDCAWPAGSLRNQSCHRLYEALQRLTSGLLGQPIEERSQLSIRFVKHLGDDARSADHGHIVRIALPSRHDVHVDDVPRCQPRQHSPR